MLLDIRPDYLQIVRDILQKHVPQYEVWAFGSRAKWTAKEYSDLDLCIVSDKPLSFAVLGAMGEDFSESDLPWKVDVVDWATTSPSFRKIIERDKVLIQDTKSGWDINSDWKLTTLGDFAPLAYGKALPERERVAGSYPVLSSGGVTGSHNQALVKSQGIVIGRKGTVGSVTLSQRPFWVIDTAFYIADEPEKRDLHFTYYLLKTLGLHLMNSDSAVPGLNRDNAHALSIRVPPLGMQKAIASTLCALDDKIALLRETNASLEAIAQAMFKSWFVNFDPVRAKADGREPEGMDADTAALFPGSFEEAESGEIPKRWQAMPLADACEINPTRRIIKGKQAPYLEMSALPTQGHRTDTPIPRAFSSGTKFINGDTLLARITPCLENGKTAFVDCLLDDEVGWGSTEYIVLRPKAPLPSYWAYLLSRHEHFRQYAIQAMVGTSGRQRVEVSRLARYLVAVPDERVSSAFAELVEPLQRSIAANDDAAKSLAMLRDRLLPRLMSGKVSLSKSQSSVANSKEFTEVL